MLRFYADKFVDAFRILTAIRTLGADYGGHPMDDREGALGIQVRALLEQFKELKMPLSVSATERLLGNIRPGGGGIPLSLIASDIAVVSSRAVDELKAVHLLSISQEQAELYGRKEPFGAKVAQTFPAAMTDIEEAGKCLALERSTASVFHLGRALELAMHAFSVRLGVALPADRDWQKFIDAINREVGLLPTVDEQERNRKSQFAHAASNLYNVKLSWRNSTMHPKSYYSLEEALEIYSASKTFMRHLADLL